MTELARRLEGVTDFPVTDRLFHAMGFDPDSGRIAPDGRLATTPNCTYRLDVLAFIGWQREREHKQFVEIQQMLNKCGVMVLMV